MFVRIQLKVLAITADGASTNCLFFKLHNPNATHDEITYRVFNQHNPDGRYLYNIFSDALHQIKTVSNAWESKKRQLWVRKMCYLIMYVNHLLLVYSVMGRISAGVILRNFIRMTRVLTDQLPDLHLS